MLVLMVELYSRTLLTLGDDEFFAVGPATATSRNPLTVDEVIGFSALLRNVAFALCACLPHHYQLSPSLMTAQIGKRVSSTSSPLV